MDPLSLEITSIWVVVSPYVLIISLFPPSPDGVLSPICKFYQVYVRLKYQHEFI